MSALDIVIPARGRSEPVEECLNTVCSESNGLDVNVIFVANGENGLELVERAKKFSDQFALTGLSLTVIYDPMASKPRAMNAADSRRRDCAVMYLDVDATLLPNTLGPLITHLQSHSEPVFVSPKQHLVMPRNLLSRHYAIVWAQLPAVANDVIGGGCYAVNKTGRSRWEKFPDLLCDDGFVRSRFAKNERHLLTDGGFLKVMPEGKALVSSVRRWRIGNEALRSISPPQDAAPCSSFPGADRLENLRHIAARPKIWPYLPGFLLVRLAANFAPTLVDGPGAWRPIRER